ncbi:MAG TPA: M13 family peptidase, partial [Bacteroidales bacterium]|nr:M13 family peptidase [Bacteroidales bacterium]
MKKNTLNLLILSLVLMLSGISCNTNKSATSATEETNHGLNLADMDTVVSPGLNFYRYADGGWLKSHPVPADRSSYSS